MKDSKGLLVFDIDGTLTSDPYSIPDKVIKCLSGYVEDGWVCMFSTGRSLSFTLPMLKDVKFPYFLSIQNGADVLKMPEFFNIKHNYINGDVVKEIDGVYGKHVGKEDFLIASGYKKGDFCYYRENRFTDMGKKYISILMGYNKSYWQSMDVFEFEGENLFPLIHCFGNRDDMSMLCKFLNDIGDVNTSFVHSPFDDDVFLTLVNSGSATKGNGVKLVKERYNVGGVVIAAGNDGNDVSMLKEADRSIVMSGSDDYVLNFADVVAPSASDMGIIVGLSKVMKDLGL